MFLLGEIPPDRPASTWSRWPQHADAEVKRLEELRDSIDWGDDDGLFYGRAALEYGLRTERDGGRLGALAGQGHRRRSEKSVRE